jgi:hypothetical protein
MPLEILELVVRASVDNTDRNQHTFTVDPTNNRDRIVSNEERAQIVREAVDEVLEILLRERDR